MDKKTLVIGSVLKPVDDTRMYEKFSLSMAKTNKYEINIIGFSAKKIPAHSQIHFYPVFAFPRTSLKRLAAPFIFFRLLGKIKPELIIVTTYELLLPSVFYHWCRQCIIVYDIQENYAKNVQNNHGIPGPFRRLWAMIITSIERNTYRWVTHYFLAEKGYLKELDFIGSKFTFLENKALKFPNLKKRSKKNDEIRFIYSGTITKIYGIYQAIQLFSELNKILVNATFTIIGHFPYPEDYERITLIAQQNPAIKVTGDISPIPHTEILEEIIDADFGIVSHQPVPSIKNCFPTRIYEYMAYQLPIILQDHPIWTNYCQKWDAAVAINFNDYNYIEIAEQIMHRKFYSKGVPSEVFWQDQEEGKLLKVLDEVVHRI